MTPIGKLIDHIDSSLCMVAVHRAWAQQYRKTGDAAYAQLQFRAARDRLEEARVARIARRQNARRMV
jgi:hypothetical protein